MTTFTYTLCPTKSAFVTTDGKVVAKHLGEALELIKAITPEGWTFLTVEKVF